MALVKVQARILCASALFDGGSDSHRSCEDFSISIFRPVPRPVKCFQPVFLLALRRSTNSCVTQPLLRPFLDSLVALRYMRI